MVRIKYKKVSESVIQSKELVSSRGVSYFTRIDYEKGLWQIFNAKRRNVIREGFSLNKNVLRRMVRRELQKLGVKLEKEFKESGYKKTLVKE
jgi:site-specific recombinase XerC